MHAKSPMMTSSQIRQSFLDFFRSKQHTLVPSSSLLPDSPNLLFTNAGMNQFVPIFLGQKKANVSKWAGAVPGLDTRAADTQKCIRAGGKHNDLDDVGLDTYHHTLFEMLGNWSFGDYFKKEAIDWAWELITEVWRFPKNRLYATVYQPDKAKGDPSDFDEEAWDLWARHFREAGLDPTVHIINGNKKDNFWMMGETGPCGPCSELHVDLTAAGDTRGQLVNTGDARCMEIWNLVFIQFNANADGTFSALPARHVDTGMGFERVAAIIQGTNGFSDFQNARISNYETDIFRPIFDAIEFLSGKKYASTLPKAGSVEPTDQEKIDIAFRVIADHIRTLSFAVADGILPGNTDRNYVLRRILRRAVRYGRTLGFREPFFYKLAEVPARTMGDVFPEVRARLSTVKEVLQAEEVAFNKTLDRGIERFDTYWWRLVSDLVQMKLLGQGVRATYKNFESSEVGAVQTIDLNVDARSKLAALGIVYPPIDAGCAFELYDTYGFPLDLTELMARERGLKVDTSGFNVLMEEQRARARASQKKTIIELSQIETKTPTRFLGFDHLNTGAFVLDVVTIKDMTAVVLNNSVCYAEMGGQVGDSGELSAGSQHWRVLETRKSGHTWLHFIEPGDAPIIGQHVHLAVDARRRAAIQRHHTATHLLHWALHEVVSPEATQKGSAVSPEKLTFDFNHAALTPAQWVDVERLVNARIIENATVSWSEVPYADIRRRKDVMQFFGDKYGDVVRVVQMGGGAGRLDGYSMELCGGTHTRATGEIGLFRIVSEAAVAAGIRRIEAVAGPCAWEAGRRDTDRIKALAMRVNSPIAELEKKIESLLVQQKELERALRAAQQREAAGRAKELVAQAMTVNGFPTILANLGEADSDTLQTLIETLRGQFNGVVVLGGHANGSVALLAGVTPDYTAKIQAGKIIQTIAPIIGGKGGGKPDFARGGGKEVGRIDEALQRARTLLG